MHAEEYPSDRLVWCAFDFVENNERVSVAADERSLHNLLPLQMAIIALTIAAHTQLGDCFRHGVAAGGQMGTSKNTSAPAVFIFRARGRTPQRTGMRARVRMAGKSP